MSSTTKWICPTCEEARQHDHADFLKHLDDEHDIRPPCPAKKSAVAMMDGTGFAYQCWEWTLCTGLVVYEHVTIDMRLDKTKAPRIWRTRVAAAKTAAAEKGTAPREGTRPTAETKPVAQLMIL